MRREDYYSPDPKAPDRFYSGKAAVLEGFDFDRVQHKIAGSTFRSTDMTHWLALDTAGRALADAGFAEGTGLAGAATGVIIGNTLTGEFSRANLMRLRWPYVKRTVGAALREQGWDDAQLGLFLGELEERYKSPFPPIDEDTLAGGLANTIAGRICNYFDFKGGGYTVDGACSSSLLSVTTASSALASGQLDVAIAGGVDLSIDPFEVIGFAKTGALATDVMRVYDQHSNGFWPGEGCGMLVLMRDEDAVEQGLFRYATIAGWGYSSDGKGGITRPEASGHRLAIQRAYAAAGFGFETVRYIEGHGTGTAVGDATELRAFTEERNAADPDVNAPAAISTVKGNIGHTKAAAGVAGLIKAILAVRHQVIPPATSHVDPHPVLTEDRPALRVPDQAELWPEGAPIRAGISSMGFGGINAHIVVEHADGVKREKVGQVTRRLVRSRQDAEILFVDAASVDELRGKAAQLAEFTAQLSYAELADLAAAMQKELTGGRVRAAVVARSPEEAVERFTKLLDLLDGGARSAVDAKSGVYFGMVGPQPRIGLLFPGQGAGRRGDGGAIRKRFSEVEDLYEAHPLPETGDLVDTENAQPRIATGSAAGLRVLRRLGIDGVGAVGHSLGEIAALHWAGAMDEDTLLRTATARGRIMGSASEGGGTMAGIASGAEEVEPLLSGEPVVIAGYNGPRQTVISGPEAAVARVTRKAAGRGLDVIADRGVARLPLRVRRPRRGSAARATWPARSSPRSPARCPPRSPAPRCRPTPMWPSCWSVRSSEPVRFSSALARTGRGRRPADRGRPRAHPARPGRGDRPRPAGGLDGDRQPVAGRHPAHGGGGVRARRAGAHRGAVPRPVHQGAEPGQEVPVPGQPRGVRPPRATSWSPRSRRATLRPGRGSGGARGRLRRQPAPARARWRSCCRLAAERAELPLEAVSPNSNAIDELHLSSITVGQILAQTSREIGVTAPLATSATATSTLAELAAMLDELAATETAADSAGPVTAPGVGPGSVPSRWTTSPRRPAPRVTSADGQLAAVLLRTAPDRRRAAGRAGAHRRSAAAYCCACPRTPTRSTHR